MRKYLPNVAVWLTILYLVTWTSVIAQAKSASLITIDDNSISLGTLFKEIKRQTGLSPAFNPKEIDDTKSLSIHLVNQPLSYVLNVLSSEGISSTITKRSIRFKRIPSDTASYHKTNYTPHPTTLLDTTINRFSITGQIVDQHGAPLPGASISVLGTRHGAAAEKNGDFILNDVSDNSTIEISLIGYESVKRSIKGNRSFKIQLKPSVSELSGVEVSTGYQNLNSDRATGSFSYVNNELLNRRVSTDVISKLEGVVPGLLFNRNTITAAGGGLDINIRGRSTLYSNDQPLIVLDGYPYNGDVKNINPNIVESITILKDAAAASIWGVKSGNGVIIIKTKRGHQNQRPSLEINTNLTFGDKPDIFYNPNFLDSKDFISVEKYLFDKGYYNASISNKFGILSPVVQSLADARNGLITNEASNEFINSLVNNDVRNQISKFYYQKAVNQQYAASITGGSDNSDYFFSVGYDKNASSLVGNIYDRITLNTTYNYNPLKKLQISLGVNYIQTNEKVNSSLSDLNSGGNYVGEIYPYAALRDNSGNNLIVQKDYRQSYKDSVQRLGFLNWDYRPLDELKRTDGTNKQLDNRISLGVQYKLPAGFDLNVKYQYERSEITSENYNSDSTYATRSLINTFTNLNSPTPYPIPIGGVFSQSSSILTYQNVRGQIDYNYMKGNSEVVALIGSEINESLSKNQSLNAYGYDQSTGTTATNINFVDYFPTNPIGNSRISNDLQFGSRTDHFLSYYGNASYTFKRKYIVSGSGRIDKSNLFGVRTNQKAIPLYSAGLSWIINNESNYKINWLPSLKLRATFGYNGNINKSATALTTISQQGGSAFYSLNYATIANPGNPDLRWERTRMINFGIDFGVLRNIVSGSFDVYFKKGLDLFGNAPLAPSVGYPTLFGNSASTKGHGFDLSLTIRNIDRNHFKWSTVLLGSYSLDKISSYATTLSNSTSFLSLSGSSSFFPIVDRPIFGIYSFYSGKLTHDTGDPQGFQSGKLSTDYQSIIANTSIDSLQFNGSARPTTFGSLRNTFSYNRFSLSFNILFKFNYFFRRNSINYSDLYGSWIGNKDFASRWQKPGDESKTIIPSMQDIPLNQDRETFYKYSSGLVQKGDHIRLQDINLSYSLTQLNGKGLAGFKNIDIYFYANNLGILWRANKLGLDPDLFGQSLPLPKTYSLGLKANF